MYSITFKPAGGWHTQPHWCGLHIAYGHKGTMLHKNTAAEHDGSQNFSFRYFKTERKGFPTEEREKGKLERQFIM